MFRISFDPAIGRFVIQVLRFGLFWVRIKNIFIDVYAGPHDKSATCSFETYEAARKYVTSIGLDQLYQDRSENVRRDYLRTT